LKRFSRREIVFVIFAATAAVIMLTGFISMNLAVAGKVGRAGDFLLPWRGVRAVFFEEIEPYGEIVARSVQMDVYQREVRAGEKPYLLDMPFQIVLLYAPLGIFGDAAVARGLYQLIAEASLLALALLSLQLSDWRPKWIFAILFFLLAGLGYYSFWSLIEGSPAILLGLVYAGILLSLRGGMDELTGALIAVSLYKWEIGGPLLVLVLLRILQQRRWRVVSGLFMALFIMMVVAFLVYPGWGLSFLRGTMANLRWNYGFTTGAIFTHMWPEWGERLGWALTAFLIIVLISEWRGGRGADSRRFHWTACLTLAATPLLGLRTEMQNLVVLLIPLAFIFAVVRERWKGGYWLGGILLALVFLVPWALFLGAGIPAGLREDLIFLFLPLFTVTGLYWIRWWAIRPPRTWLERANVAEYR
jgi:hypothetical protein